MLGKSGLLVAWGALFLGAVASNAAVVNFEDGTTQRPDLGFRTQSVGGASDFANVAGHSNGDPGNWSIEGTNGAKVLGFWGSWNSFNQSYSGDGDTIYTSIYFTQPNTMTPMKTDVSFDVVVSSGNGPSANITVYGFNNHSGVPGQWLSFSPVTVNGFSEYKASVTFSGVDELRFYSNTPGGMDNFVFAVPEPTIAGGLLAASFGLMIRKRAKRE